MSTEYQQLKDVYDHERERCEESRTRLNRARNRLYIATLATIDVYVTNAIPTRIEPLGIDFGQLEARNIVPLMSLVSAYFLLVYIAREFQFQAAMVALKLTGQQLNSNTGSLAPSEYRKDQAAYDRVILLLGAAGRRFLAVLLTVVPLLLGLLAILIGLLPTEMEWLKSTLVATEGSMQ